MLPRCPKNLRGRKRRTKGQSTVEYVLFMGLLAVVILTIGRGMISRIRDLAGNRVTRIMTSQFLGGPGSRDQLYRFRILR